MDLFSKSHAADPSFAPTQLGYGMMLYEQHRYEEALALLDSYVDIEDKTTELGYLLALAECMVQAKDTERALDVTQLIIERDPARTDLMVKRAEILEEKGNLEAAEGEWLRYLDQTGNARVDATFTVRQRIARLARSRGDLERATEQLREALILMPNDIAMIENLVELLETQARWEEAAEARLRLLELQTDGTAKQEQTLTLARLYAEKLQTPSRALALLQEAAFAKHPDAIKLRVEILLAKGSVDEAVALANEHDPTLIGAPMWGTVGNQRLVDGDLEGARDAFAQASLLDPDEASYQDALINLAKPQEPMVQLPPEEEDVETQVVKLLDQANASSNWETTVMLLRKALELAPDRVDIKKLLAGQCAVRPDQYDEAIRLYRDVLTHDPVDPPTLRVLARLYGQRQNNERAYLHYVALLALAPADEEAKGWAALRRAHPPAPPRAPDQGDLQLVGIPSAAPKLDQLFVPLARVAEVTHAAELSEFGVEAKDRLPPADEKLQWLLHVLEPVGLDETPIYLWRSGASGCQWVTQDGGVPALLLGASLYEDASPRQLAFLVARLAYLYVQGLVLCDILPKDQLQQVVHALCKAIDSDSSRPAPVEWVNVIRRYLQPGQAEQFLPRVHDFLQTKESVDAWAKGAQQRANRLALATTGDVELAVSALLRDSSGSMLREDELKANAAALDLFQFALSEAYFELSTATGCDARSILVQRGRFVFRRRHHVKPAARFYLRFPKRAQSGGTPAAGDEQIAHGHAAESDAEGGCAAHDARDHLNP